VFYHFNIEDVATLMMDGAGFSATSTSTDLNDSIFLMAEILRNQPILF